MGAETTNETSDTHEVKREELGLSPKNDDGEKDERAASSPRDGSASADPGDSP